MFVPLLTQPPDTPLPDPSANSKWYSEVWIKYALDQTLSPTYFGQVFSTNTRLWIIINEYCQEMFESSSEMNLSRANEFNTRIKSCYDVLPQQLQPTFMVLPGHFFFQQVVPQLLTTSRSPLTMERF